ncbi:MAG TPA: DUF3306 domain-containing protein, partial [Steroidobacteraceae bacterium]|nr:DUF3306 domain-containing protein [Steroidobacteraceae bacterium]
VRRAALRKLFASAKFNVCDGLDVYCRDYTQFEPLGDIVTADMRFHMERAAKLAAALAEREAAAAEAAAASSASAGSEAELDGGETDPPGRNTDDDPVEPA